MCAKPTTTNPGPVDGVAHATESVDLFEAGTTDSPKRHPSVGRFSDKPLPLNSTLVKAYAVPTFGYTLSKTAPVVRGLKSGERIGVSVRHEVRQWKAA
jgi:hypothetical protein